MVDIVVVPRPGPSTGRDAFAGLVALAATKAAAATLAANTDCPKRNLRALPVLVLCWVFMICPLFEVWCC